LAVDEDDDDGDDSPLRDRTNAPAVYSKSMSSLGNISGKLSPRSMILLNKLTLTSPSIFPGDFSQAKLDKPVSKIALIAVFRRDMGIKEEIELSAAETVRRAIAGSTPSTRAAWAVFS
jgi:hypothetical protein